MAPTWIANLLQSAFLLLSWVRGPQTDLEIFSSSSCLRTAATLEALVTCLDRFTVPHAYYDSMTYDLAQPVGTQREDWMSAIQALLSADGNCALTSIPLSLQGLYTVEPFQEYCVLYETASRCGTYLKGWGFFITPSSHRRVWRNIHISAPHPAYDLGTVQQAAAVFEATGARSLLVPGRKRTAFLSNSECIVPTSPKQDYYRTDPAHNDHQELGGCPSSSCAFLQFHGKGASTCPGDDIFLSSGLGNSTASQSWYTDPTDRPVKRLHQNLQHFLPSSWKISMPRAANTRTVTGEFVHAEQASTARRKEWYGAWVRAVEESFEVVCDAGLEEVAEEVKTPCLRPTTCVLRDTTGMNSEG
ncbi:hypothetical protein CPB84DRAFT_1784621 [Gymnopilus junonius]|uniref:Uncharacterized protein n=1 Tax=Gymnopilus junonius TaxID=109634 RepID=A0A9P5TLT1_GYMJU|nr:hypothetical protein CPB84DRAFT_1784621 [Gymnopilus junonius]